MRLRNRSTLAVEATLSTAMIKMSYLHGRVVFASVTLSLRDSLYNYIKTLLPTMQDDLI